MTRNHKTNIIYRIISGFLSVILLISTVMAGTLAWIDFNQHKTNMFIHSSKTYTVELNKYEKSINGQVTTTIVKGSEFYLFKEEDTNKIVQIGERYTTGNDGRISVYGLPPGDYYFLETNPTYAYTYDKDAGGKEVTKYRFTISDETIEANETVPVTAYNQRLTAALQIKKAVKNADNTPITMMQKDMQFEFTVTFSDGGTYQYSINNPADPVPGAEQQIASGGKLYLKDGQTAEFRSLPVGVQYTVTETPVAGYTISSNNNQNNIPLEGITADFTNTYQDLLFGTLNISKQVSGDGADTDKEFIFTVLFGGEESYTYRIGDAEYTLPDDGKITLKHNETAVFEHLPVGLDYTVTEDDYRPQYVTFSQNTSGMITQENTTASFINHKISEHELTGFLSITKQVTGGGAEQDRAFDFTVTFDEDSNASYTYFIGGNMHTFTNGGKISLKHRETAIFVNLPADLHYTVTEDDYSTDGYTTSAENESGVIPLQNVAGVMFTNDKPGEEIKLIVKKKVAGEIPATDVDKEFDFTVIINGEETKFKLKDGQEEFFTMPIGAVYEVIEENYFEDGYLQTTVTNGYGTATGTTLEVIKTNTYIGTVYIEIIGEKTWDMSADPAVELPKSITLYLKNGDTIIETKVVEPTDRSWKYTFTAPKYDDQGNEIVYTIEEGAIAGFTSVVEGYDIKNIYVPSITVNLPVEKIIDGTPSEKSDFTFEMTPQTAGAPMPTESTGGKKTVTITGAGKIEFGAMKFEKAGVYVYKIVETQRNVEGSLAQGSYTYDTTIYTATVNITKTGNALKADVTYTNQDGDPLASPVFTNIYHPDTPVSVKVTKVWDDGGSTTRPSSVKVQLYKNGAASGAPVALNMDNNWTHTWADLDKDAAWTVDETSVPSDYTKKITGNAGIGFVITNSKPYTPPPAGETVKISGIKTWVHGDNPESERPASITIYVKDGDVLAASMEASITTHWQWHFELPKYRADGTEIKYTVDEAPVKDYAKEIDGYNIKNTHKSYDPKGKTTITGSKTWVHGSSAADRHPASIIVYIKDGTRIVAERQITAADGWKWSIEVPRYNDDGKAMTYTVSEGNVPYYTCEINGYHITNTFKGYDYPGDLPKTGDNNHIALWIVLVLASMSALAVLVFRRKRANENI